VILEPAAVAEMVAFLSPEFSATVVDDGRSFLSNRQGQQIFGKGIRLTADPYHPLHQGRPFDELGDPTRRVVLVEDGRHQALVYDRVAARRHGVEPTGHALRVPSTEGAVAGHLVLDGGEQSLSEMIASTRRGILVSRVWYTRTVDPARLLITGMTRDGTFWIEGGEIRHGIRNLRFNQSVPDLLSTVVAAGKPEYAWPAVVPPLKVEGFRFTSETSF
jgi:predicted Zn-dependent protease